jgi:hypothetical protein
MSDLTEAYIDLMMKLEQITGKGQTIEVYVSPEQFDRLTLERVDDRQTYFETGLHLVRELGLTNGNSTIHFKPGNIE